MRFLLWIVLAAALAWSGWWVLGSRAALYGAEAAFAAAPAAGWQATNHGIAIAGFPSRFDLTVTDPAIARDGWGWRGPFLQVFALAYRPAHMIAAFPPAQTLTLAGTEVTLTAGKMQASLILSGTALDNATLAAETPVLAGIAAASATLALKSEPHDPSLYRLGAEVLDLAMPPQLRPEALPPVARRLFLNAHVRLSAPLDRQAAAAPPRIENLQISQAFLAWGDLVMGVDGVLKPDAAGFAEGRLTVTLSDPALAGDVLSRAGLLPEGAVPPSDLPLVLAGGRIRLGPFDLGPAPRLVP